MGPAGRTSGPEPVQPPHNGAGRDGSRPPRGGNDHPTPFGPPAIHNPATTASRRLPPEAAKPGAAGQSHPRLANAPLRSRSHRRPSASPVLAQPTRQRAPPSSHPPWGDRLGAIDHRSNARRPHGRQADPTTPRKMTQRPGGGCSLGMPRITAAPGAQRRARGSFCGHGSPVGVSGPAHRSAQPHVRTMPAAAKPAPRSGRMGPE